MNQSVMVFANSAARSAALTLPTEGMVTYLQDTDELEIYNGSAWLRAVVTSDDESISTSGNITSSAGNISATAGNISAGGSATISGDLTVDTSSLRVDATNNVVGIMTATPSTGQYNDWSVDIASGRIRIAGQRSGDTAGIALGFGTPTASWYNGTAFMGLDGNANSSSVGFWHSGAWRQLITASGHVSAPYQPAFSAYHQTGGSVVFPVGTLVFNSTRFNTGSGYNTANGRFTAPTAGKYFFHTAMFKYTTYANASNTYWGFNVNAGSYHWINHGAQGYDGGQSLSAFVSMNAGDYIEVVTNSSIETYREWYNTFEGFKVA